MSLFECVCVCYCCHHPGENFLYWYKMSFCHCRPSCSKQKQTHTQAHTLKLNKNTAGLVQTPDNWFCCRINIFYSVPLPAVFRSFSWCLYTFLLTFDLLHLEHLGDSNAYFRFKQTFSVKMGPDDLDEAIWLCVDTAMSIHFRQLNTWDKLKSGGHGSTVWTKRERCLQLYCWPEVWQKQHKICLLLLQHHHSQNPYLILLPADWCKIWLTTVFMLC